MWHNALRHWQEPGRDAFLNQLPPRLTPQEVLKVKSPAQKTWVEQALLRQNYRDKFPAWCQHPEVFLPPSLHLQQATAEAVAIFKSTLLSGDHYWDLTAGMGMDLWGMRGAFSQFSGTEPHPPLAEITHHNLTAWGLPLNLIPDSAEAHYRAIPPGCVVGLDPDRRPGTKASKGDFTQHLPNPVPIWDFLSKHGHSIVLKAAPMADITALQQQLPGASHLWVIAWKNEVRELLWARLHPGQPLQLMTVRLDASGPTILAWDETKRKSPPPVAAPSQWIMDPYPEIHKAGVYAELCERYGLAAVGHGTRLFTGNQPHSSFPGWTYRNLGWVNKATDLPQGARIISRNHPQSSDALRASWKIKENQAYLLAAITNHEGSKKYLSGALWHPEGSDGT